MSNIRLSYLPMRTRIKALKACLSFGEVAAWLGLKGASPAGWQCPTCLAPACLKERADHQGGKCTACGKGYDILTLVCVARGVAPANGVALLDRVLSDITSPDARQEDLL